jgi:hypothetical protein
MGSDTLTSGIVSINYEASEKGDANVVNKINTKTKTKLMTLLTLLISSYFDDKLHCIIR